MLTFKLAGWDRYIDLKLGSVIGVEETEDEKSYYLHLINHDCICVDWDSSREALAKYAFQE